MKPFFFPSSRDGTKTSPFQGCVVCHAQWMKKVAVSPCVCLMSWKQGKKERTHLTIYIFFILFLQKDDCWKDIINMRKCNDILGSLKAAEGTF